MIFCLFNGNEESTVIFFFLFLLLLFLVEGIHKSLKTMKTCEKFRENQKIQEKSGKARKTWGKARKTLQEKLGKNHEILEENQKIFGENFTKEKEMLRENLKPGKLRREGNIEGKLGKNF